MSFMTSIVGTRGSFHVVARWPAETRLWLTSGLSTIQTRGFGTIVGFATAAAAGPFGHDLKRASSFARPSDAFTSPDTPMTKFVGFQSAWWNLTMSSRVIEFIDADVVIADSK